MLVVQVGECVGYQGCVGQFGCCVVFGVLGDCVGLGYGGFQVGVLQVGGVGVVFVLVKVDGYCDVVIVGGFYCFDFVQVYIYIQFLFFVVVDFGLVGVQGFGLFQQVLGDVGQLFQVLQVVVGWGDFRGDYV